MKNQNKVQHLGFILLIFTVIIWGATFIVTKKLLVSFSPTEILIYRFSISFLVLLMIYPKILKWMGLKTELLCMAAALSGMAIYQFLENTALVYTYASNVSIIIACAAFFTALFSKLVFKEMKIGINFLIGFVISISGIILISFNGAINLKLNPLGDLMALCASILWGVYSVIVKVLSKKAYNVIQLTRRITMYGVIFLIPLFFMTDSKLDLSRFLQLDNTLYMLYLGVIASAICFCTWNYAVDKLGSIKSSLGIYAIPVVTAIASLIFLDEKISLIGGIGIAITLVGLYISSGIKKKKRKNQEIEAKKIETEIKPQKQEDL